MKERNNIKLHTYVLINYNEPPPILPQKELQMTEKEAHARNQVFALNHTTKRYIKK